ncbi:MAG: ECF-type sigma factor [Candidatus Eisenbacteria bacterium]
MCSHDGSDDPEARDPNRDEFTTILSGLDQVEPAKAELDRLFVLLHDELRSIARGQLQAEANADTLQPTALVHEAYLRLVHVETASSWTRTQFLVLAARAMRWILVDHARQSLAQKRGGRRARVSLDEASEAMKDDAFDVVELEDALLRLGHLDQRMEVVVQCRVFAGMSMQEIGDALGVSRRTVHEDWKVASMWLARELGGTPPAGAAEPRKREDG